MEKEIIIIRDYNQDTSIQYYPSFGNLLMIKALSYSFLSLPTLLAPTLDNDLLKSN